MSLETGRGEVLSSMRLDSVEKTILWIGATLGIIGESIVLAVSFSLVAAGLMVLLGLILLNCVYFLEKTVSDVMAVLLMVLCLICCVLVPVWYTGAIALPVIAACFVDKIRLCRCLGIFSLAVTLVLSVCLGKLSVIPALITLGFLLLAYLVWEGMLYLMRTNEMTNARLENALRASAVDAMEQRTLREEIAKNQSVNEHNARLQERERISREIHNYVGHTLSAATVTLDAASMLVPNDQDKALEKIDVANSRVHEAISSVRSVVRTLDADDDKIELSEYMKSLERLVDEFKMDTDIKVYHNFSQIDSKDRIPMRDASFLSSSLSELLTNGVKHGEATIFVITFVYDGKNIRMKVQDNGCGFGDISVEEKKIRINNGFGLRKMVDQAEKWGGTCIIDSVDGFTVSLSLPLEG